MVNLQHLHHSHRSQLRPFLEMLKYKNHELTREKWMSLVKTTEEHIINAPDQYLTDVPQREILESSIHYLFSEFLRELGYAKDHDGSH